MTQPTQPNPAPQEKPAKPNEGQNVGPKRGDVEINPAKPANDTEVDLDKSKTKTYPPERH